MNREQILEVFKTKEVVTVKFYKVDGTLRTMQCTLNPAWIPKVEKESTKKKADSNHNVCVYDVEKNGWRSFNVDSVVEIG